MPLTEMQKHRLGIYTNYYASNTIKDEGGMRDIPNPLPAEFRPTLEKFEAMSDQPVGADGLSGLDKINILTDYIGEFNEETNEFTGGISNEQRVPCVFWLLTPCNELDHIPITTIDRISQLLDQKGGLQKIQAVSLNQDIIRSLQEKLGAGAVIGEAFNKACDIYDSAPEKFTENLNMINLDSLPADINNKIFGIILESPIASHFVAEAVSQIIKNKDGSPRIPFELCERIGSFLPREDKINILGCADDIAYGRATKETIANNPLAKNSRGFAEKVQEGTAINGKSL